MRPNNFNQRDEHPHIVQDNLVRVIGRFLGRIIATISASACARYYHENYVDIESEQAQSEQPQAGQAQANQTQAEQVRVRMNRALLETRRDASVAAAAIFTWNAQIGGATGADACEYVVNRISNFTTQDMADTAYLPSGPSTIVDRVTDNFLWRFASYATDRFPQLRDVLQPPQPRQDGYRFRY